MPITAEQIQQLTSLVESAQTIVVLIPLRASAEQVVTAVAWTKQFTEMGKEARLVSPGEVAVPLDQLKVEQEITSQLGKRNLVISFEYVPEQVDKVSYHIGEETGRFYLTIKPKAGTLPLAKESLEVDYAGADADLAIYVGVNDLDELQPLSGEYADFFRDIPGIVLANGGTPFGSLKITTSDGAGVAEETTAVFGQLGWSINADAATALLYGIEEATDQLRSLATTPNTFEQVAMLLRAGARRVRRHAPERAFDRRQEVKVERVAAQEQSLSFADALKHDTAGRQEQSGSSPDTRSSRQNGGYQGRKRQRSAQSSLNPDPAVTGGSGRLM